MKIAVVGTGYVGLVAGTCFADSGHDVVCVDVDAKKVERLRQGETVIYEPGLGELLEKNLAAERLSFTTELGPAAEESEVIFIAVGTPQGDDGNADLRVAMTVAGEIAGHVRKYTVVVNKSTVPVGTAARMQAEFDAKKVPVDVVSNPEFLKEGAALDDFMRPDRIVIGASSDRARTLMAELYAPFVRTESPIHFMDPRSAELTKYAANAMLASRISFMNEMAMLCERVGADVDAVRKAMGSDVRIGQKFLFPGCGYGGSCFPKDVKALIATARNNGLDFALLAAVDAVNDRQKRLLAQKAKQHYGGSLRGKKFGVWGIAFKPKTDDLRAAPALALIDELLAEGAQVSAHDPVGMENARAVYGDRIQLVPNMYSAAKGADALFLVTEWNEFRQPDFARIKKAMAQPVLFDGRNIWNPQRMRELGFTYFGVGRAA